MSFIILKREPIANTAPDTGFTVTAWTYSTDTRAVSLESVQSPINTGPYYSPYELAVDALVPGASFCLGTTQREVRYGGDGTVYTQDVAGAIACASSLVGVLPIVTGQSKIDQNDGSILATWVGGSPPFTVRCGLIAPGRPDVPEFSQVVHTPGYLAAFPPVTPGVVYVPGMVLFPNVPWATTRTFTPIVNPGLGPGRYRVQVTEDATGFTVSADVVLGVNLPNLPNQIVLNNNDANTARLLLTIPVDTILLSVEMQRDGGTTIVRHRYWNGVTKTVQSHLATLIHGMFTPLPTNLSMQGYPSTFGIFPELGVGQVSYNLPPGVDLDLIGTDTVCSDGQGGIYLRAASTGTRRLRVDNIVVFHPDRADEANGGLFVELDAQLDPDHQGFTFTLSEGATTVATNATGYFDGLGAGEYSVLCTSTDPRWSDVEVTIQLKARYFLRYFLDFDDLINNKPCRLEIWTKADTTPEELEGTGVPVYLDTQGLEGGPLQADLGSSMGTSLEMNLRATAGQLEDLLLEDRAARADFYYNEKLRFRGYVQPDTYEEPLLGGTVEVSLIATCGLAALSETDFAGNTGQELRGRRPVLNTLLHCLSRCDVALPLNIYTHRTALEMTTAEVTELAIYTDRLGYLNDKGEPLDCRTVVNAICQFLGGPLVQRQGSWEVRSILEAETTTVCRHYLPAGTAYGPITSTSPAATIKPSTLADSVDGDWYWIEASQRMQRRAGWKSLQASADAGFAKNAFRQGDYFSADFMWSASGYTLLSTAGWKPGAAIPGLAAFPLQLVEAGKQADTGAALYPRAYVPNVYLESETAPLAAGSEGLAMRLGLTAKFITVSQMVPAGGDDYVATLLAEVVAEDADGVLKSFGHVFTLPLAEGIDSDFTSLSFTVPFGLMAGTNHPRIRLHPFQVTLRHSSTNYVQPYVPATTVLVQTLSLELLPQGAEWDAADTFTALGPGGTVRPSDPIDVFHTDTPAAAGVFQGNAHAFRRTVTRGLTGPTSLWSRPTDETPSPLIANAVLDVLALRGNPSRVLTGSVRHLNAEYDHPFAAVPEPLDAVDAPYDIDGRRWVVANRRWNPKDAITEIAILEAGVGQFLTPPVYDDIDGVLLAETIVLGLDGNYYNTYVLSEEGEPIVYEE